MKPLFWFLALLLLVVVDVTCYPDNYDDWSGEYDKYSGEDSSLDDEENDEEDSSNNGYKSEDSALSLDDEENDEEDSSNNGYKSEDSAFSSDDEEEEKKYSLQESPPEGIKKQEWGSVEIKRVHHKNHKREAEAGFFTQNRRAKRHLDTAAASQRKKMRVKRSGFTITHRKLFGNMTDGRNRKQLLGRLDALYFDHEGLPRAF